MVSHRIKIEKHTFTSMNIYTLQNNLRNQIKPTQSFQQQLLDAANETCSLENMNKWNKNGRENKNKNSQP